MHGPRFGDVVDWSASEAHRFDILGFPRARLVLEAQALLMRVLYKIARGILSESDDVNSPPST